MYEKIEVRNLAQDLSSDNAEYSKTSVPVQATLSKSIDTFIDKNENDDDIWFPIAFISTSSHFCWSPLMKSIDLIFEYFILFQTEIIL